jgi:choloylglycine hydrolase
MKFIAMQATSRSTCLSLYRRLSLKAGMIASSLSLGLLVTAPAFACTRVLYSGSDNTVITGRSMDWMKDNSPNLWAMPKGVKRDGATGPGSITWAAKYGSVVVSMYDIGTVDGINEKGLVANVLYLAESNYGRANGKPTLSITAWGQYVLDNFASVKDAAQILRQEPFRVVAPTLPDGHPATGHLAISDPSGDSAIFEYVDGKLVIHHGKQYNVMTNSPTYDQQLALNSYWQGIGGTAFLPGTSRAADRFARASFLVNAIPKSVDPDIITAVPNRSFDFQAMASVLSVMRSVSVPLGTKDPKLPNIASTLWRTTYDQKQGVLVFDSATSPTAFWVNLSDLNLSQGQPVRKLTLAGGRTYSGNVSSQFTPANAFQFLGGKPQP